VETRPTPGVGGAAIGNSDAGDGAGGAGGSAGGVGGTSFANTAPPLGAALPLTTPGEWVWNDVPGSMCRDGSPAGFWVKRSTSGATDLVLYLEGGGACLYSALCTLNASNLKERMLGEVFDVDPEHPLGIRKATSAEPFRPYTGGIFDTNNPENPVRDWNMVFVPYCTGDAHGGTRRDVVVPDDASGNKQQFVGYSNMQKFVSRIAPTFADARKVLLAGTSAGGYGAGLNFNQVQDAFRLVGSARVTVLMDSAVIYDDKYLHPCLQKKWRDLWGLNGALPPDCPECQRADGGGFLELIFFSGRKYPEAQLGVLTATHDSIMRFFLAAGENECATPPPFFVPEAKYEEALTSLRVQVKSSPVGDGFCSYFIESGAEPLRNTPYDQIHQWLPFDRFYVRLASNVSPAAWLARLLNGDPTTVGP
jgi:hypothetical protein